MSDRERERFRSWFKAAQEFGTAYQKRAPNWTVEIDLSALYHATISYFHDVDRYKAWHMDKKGALINDLKKAAFAVYWLSRYRPIRVKHHSGINLFLDASNAEDAATDVSSLANTMFALMIAYNYIKYCYASDIESSIFYLIQYRHPTAETFLTMIQALNDARGLGDHAFTEISWTSTNSA